MQTLAPLTIDRPTGQDWTGPYDNTVRNLCINAHNLARHYPSDSAKQPEHNDKLHLCNIHLLLHIRPMLRDREARDRAIWSINNLRDQIVTPSIQTTVSSAIAAATQT